MVVRMRSILKVKRQRLGMSEATPTPIKRDTPRSGSRAAKFKRLVEILEDMIDRDFTGHVKINFSQGGIGRIEKVEEINTGIHSDN